VKKIKTELKKSIMKKLKSIVKRGRGSGPGFFDLGKAAHRQKKARDTKAAKLQGGNPFKPLDEWSADQKRNKAHKEAEKKAFRDKYNAKKAKDDEMAAARHAKRTKA
jgi:hypothetical protein